MNYLQLNIDGRLHGLKFNQMMYMVFYENLDQERFTATFYYAAVYAALKANAYVKKEEFITSFEEVCDWVDGMTEEDKEKVMEVFNGTAYWKEQVKKGKELTEEKTPAEKKSKLKSTTKKV